MTYRNRSISKYANGATLEEIGDAVEGIIESGLTPEEIASLLQGTSTNHFKSTYPEGFNWPLSGDVWENFYAIKNGDSYECTVKPEDLIDLSEYTNTLYVDIGVADSSGGGTSWSDAEKGIDQAVTTAIASGLPTKIFIKGGTYNRSYSLGTSGTRTLSNKIALIAVYGDVYTGVFDDLSWTQNSTYSVVYESTRSAAVHCVNPLLKDSYGNYTPYVAADSLAGCAATQGTWYTDNTTTYVHGFESEVINNKCARVYLGTTGASFSGDYDIYCYGINFEQGNSGAFRNLGGSTNTVVMHNCSAKYAVSGSSFSGRSAIDGYQILGCKLFAAFNSDASNNSKDGFNVHMEGDIYPSLLTVNCTAYNNGQIVTDSQSNNGITVHDGCKAIDIGGKWLGSVGTNAGHVSDNTQVWHFGSTAGMSEGDIYNGGAISWGAFGMWSGTNSMWLEYCTDIGSSIGVYSSSTSSIYYKGHTGMGSKSGTGNFVEF